MTQQLENWYTSWFDTEYYHILYKDRDHTEAQQFMDRLTRYLNLPEKAAILDLACGKGRHSVYLNSLGYDVTGADLSHNSIAYAKQFENDTLRFVEHDMCCPMGKRFDAIFNLFTSFGYFDKEADNLNALRAIKQELKPNGFGIIDFMNVDHVVPNLVAEDEKVQEGIRFRQKRFVEDGHIMKTINFEDQGRSFHFQEKVRALTLQDFEAYFEKANITLLEVFGDYKLNKFEPKTSERLIMLFN